MSDLEIIGTEILETCRQKLTPSTQLQNRSFHGKDKRPTLKCTKIKNACVTRAKLLVFIGKYAKLFGPILDATIPIISSQRRGSKPSNFTILLGFLALKTCQKISFSIQADCTLTTGFSGQKSSRNFRENRPQDRVARSLVCANQC